MGGTEQAYVREAFDTNWLSTVGPHLTALEDEFEALAGSPALAVASGTAGLHLALRMAEVQRGDEVVTQTLSFVASANPILYEGARPLLVDSEPGTWNLDPELLSEIFRRRAAVGRLPRAVIVVHLFGQPARIAEIKDLCDRYGVVLIEDAAESLGSRYQGRHPGTFGDIGVFSFNGNKMITGTTGGMVVSRDPGRLRQARHWSTQARDPDPERINNYCHSELGYNYRMSNVVAGIVRGQLQVLEQRVAQRRAVFERYREAFARVPGLDPQPDGPDVTGGKAGGWPDPLTTWHSRWLSCFLVNPERFGRSNAELIHWLDAANVEARPVWRPMHQQRLFGDCERSGGAVADDLNRRGICLPSSSSLTIEDQEVVIDAVRRAFRG